MCFSHSYSKLCFEIFVITLLNCSAYYRLFQPHSLVLASRKKNARTGNLLSICINVATMTLLRSFDIFSLILQKPTCVNLGF